MNRTDAPVKQSTPFAVNGQRESILPTTPAGDNTASYSDGFPAITMILKSAGGLPPKGQDMNQILYELSALARWGSSGAINAWDAAFSTAIGGYPMGAQVLGTDGTTRYISTTDSNATNPNTGGAGWFNLTTGYLKTASNLSEIAAAGPAAVAEALANLGLGDAAKSRVLQSAGDSVKDVMSQNAISYLLSLKAGVNGEKVEAEKFRAALDLGNAALKNTGTGQGQLPDMSAFLSNQEMNGYQYLPGGLILQWGNAPCEDQRTTASKFPIPFPNECLMVIVCGYQVAGTYQAYAVANGDWYDKFSWNAFYAQSGNIPVLAAAGQVTARFLAIGR